MVKKRSLPIQKKKKILRSLDANKEGYNLTSNCTLSVNAAKSSIL
jgi:hypothetical protein